MPHCSEQYPEGRQTLDVFIIDDHAMFRSGLALVIQQGIPDVRVFEAGSLAGALRLDTPPALILLDVHLEGINGLDGMAALQSRWPDAAILVVSAENGPDLVRRALDLGARGFLPKTAAAAEVLRVIGELRRGRPGPVATAPRADAGAAALTPRQAEVLDLLVRGQSNKLIARSLGVSENTVRWHVQCLLELLQVSSRAEAAYAARRRGLIS